MSKKENELAVEIGRRIAAMREAKPGLTVREFAKKLGVQPDAVSRIQRGESTVQFVKLLKIAEILETTPNELLGVKERPAVTGYLSEERLRGAMLGLAKRLAPQLDRPMTEKLVAAALGVGRNPEAPASDVSSETEAEIQSAFAVQQLLGAKPQ